MLLLDRFRSPLRSRDADVRRQYVENLAEHETDTLVGVACGDPDAGVRAEAVQRLKAPRLLLQIVAEASDPDVRELARKRSEHLLVRIAADNRDLGESQRALELIEPLPAVARVACRAHFRPVWSEAVARLVGAEGDVGRDEALTRVAATAKAPQARKQALAAVRGQAALARVALSAKAKHVAQAATRRLVDPDELLRVAEKAPTAKVRGLARRLFDERVPADHPEQVRAREARIREWLDRLEALQARGGAAGARRALLDRARALVGEGPVEPELLARLEAAETASTRTAARPGLAHRMLVPPTVVARAAPAPDRMPKEAASVLARLEDPAEELTLAQVDACDQQLGRLLGDSPDGAADRWRSAVKSARDRAWERKRQRIAAFRFEEMVDQAKALAKSAEGGVSGRDAGLARKDWAGLKKRFERLALPQGADPAPFHEAMERVDAALTGVEEERQRKRRKAEKRLERLEERLAALETAEPFRLGQAESALRDLAALRSSDAWRFAGPERQGRLQRSQAALMPRLREARELREWQFWSNLDEQQELLRKARALLEVKDLRRVDRELTRLEHSWFRARHTRGEQGQEIWDEWTEVCAELLERVGPIREAAEQEQNRRLEALASLVVRAESIAESADPKRVAEMRGLMTSWRENSKGLGKQTDALWKRFHSANDQYFTQWKKARKRHVAELEANVPVREELISQARKLEDVADAGQVRSAVRDLMRAWKEAPPIPRKRSDPLWEEFRTACDRARDRFRDGAARNGGSGKGVATCLKPEEEQALREALAGLAALDPGERARAAEPIWSEYRRLYRDPAPGSERRTGVPAIEREFVASLQDAFEASPDTFAGTRFDQHRLIGRLEARLAETRALDSRSAKAPARGGAAQLAAHLERSLRRGGAADRDAEAREAANAAARTLERARLSGPAVAPAARACLADIEKLARRLIAKAPRTPPGPTGFSGPRRGKGRRRPFRSRPMEYASPPGRD